MKQFKNVSLDENLDALNPFAKFRTNGGNSTYSSIYGLVRTGPTGPTGPAGPTGYTGPAGSTGTCTCAYISTGELITNGGMELFTVNIPTGWITTTPHDISQVTQQGRVHSGNSSVNLSDGARLGQIVSINPGCFYELSFFAHGVGSQVELEATVTFKTPQGDDTPGLQIAVMPNNIPDNDREFAFYRGITVKAPAGSTTAEVFFTTKAGDEQSLDLDDISFIVQ